MELGHCTLISSVSRAVFAKVAIKRRVTREAFRSSKEWWPYHLVINLMNMLSPMFTASRRAALEKVRAMAMVR